MSIEASGSVSSPKTVAGTENHAAKGKGKAKSGGEVDALAGGGFAALLTSVESATDGNEGGIGQEDVAKATDIPLPTADLPPSLALPPKDAVIPLTQNMSIDVAMLLAQSGQVAADKLDALRDERPVGGKGVGRLMISAMAGDKQDMLAKASAALGGGTVDFQQNADAGLDLAAQALPSRAAKVGGAESQSGAAALLAESRTTKLSTLVDTLASEPTLAGAMANSGIGDSYLRQADRASTKSSASSAGAGVESIWGSHPLLQGSGVDAPAVMADPSSLSLESTVANTVSYWVTQGIQNAELKLEGFGGEPVEVSISLKGDEARIDFRTDQPEVRQVLEGAVAHLKDLLANEGLVLSGVSVGASGQKGAGTQQDQHNRPDARSANVLTKAVVATEPRPRVNPSVGRALDIFV